MKTIPIPAGPTIFLSLMLASLPGVSPGVEPANPDSHPLTDQSSKANEEARKVRDNAKAAGTDVTKVEDSNPQKASPDAHRNRDGSQLASPDAAKVSDGNDDKASPYSRETSSEERLRNAQKPSGQLPDPAAGITDAEIAVRNATEEATTLAEERKLQLHGQGDAGSLIEEILGPKSALSRAELARAGQSEARRVIREDRRDAVDFLKRRLKGNADPSQAPAFFRRSADLPLPLFEGKRFLHFSSTDEVPAILLASAKLERVRVQTAEEARLKEGMPTPPKPYRGTDARFVSYSIHEASMINSGDFYFQDDSTQFADGHSYDMAFALADALKDPDLAGSRFIVEVVQVSGSGIAEGPRETAQLRAEAIARELVRAGVSPLSLIPVGYGKDEASLEDDVAPSNRRGMTRVLIARVAEPALAEVPAE